MKEEQVVVDNFLNSIGKTIETPIEEGDLVQEPTINQQINANVTKNLVGSADLGNISISYGVRPRVEKRIAWSKGKICNSPD